MRVNTVNQNPNAGGGFDIAGATLTGPLILAADPTQALEAATKKYIDNAVSSLNASHITTGTLPVGRLPAFSGDFSNIAGTNALTLNTVAGLTPGTFTKVTVDAKGRVQSGGNLTLADIPGFDWSKIANNKPTTIDGYGITDAVKNTSDVMTGPLILHAAPTLGGHAATKGYVDGLSSGSAALSTGDTIRRTSTATPTGFLRCNGGVVSKTTYPALYAVVGNLGTITAYSVEGNGRPDRNQFDINKVSGGALGAWTTASKMPVDVSNAKMIITKNLIIVIAGYNGSTARTIQTAPIDVSGNIGAWSYSTNLLPTSFQNFDVAVFNNKVYLFTTNSNAINIYTSTINSDGTLTAFTAAINYGTAAGGTMIDNCSVVLTKNRFYILGGHDGNNWTNACYYVPVASDGTLGTPVGTNGLPTSIGAQCCFTTKNRVYLLGGIDSSTNVRDVVYTAPINADGSLGTWSNATSGSFPVNTYGARAVVVKDMVYVIGGSSGGVYRATVNADGTLGGWVANGSLPGTCYQGDVVVSSGKIYTFGNGSSGNIYSTSLSGGLNDYSYWESSNAPAGDPNNFTLPDTTTTDAPGVYTFIKT